MDSAYSTPSAPSTTHDRIPEEIRQRQAWCPFKFELRDGKRTKIPYNPRTGWKAKSNAPKTWSPFEEASRAEGYDGIEYILSGDDPYFLLDLDGCRNPKTGEITPEAQEIISPFVGKAYIEASVSGEGVHVAGRGKKPGTAWCRNPALGIELYDWGRPVVFTGDVLEGSTSELGDCREELDRLYHDYMPEHLKNPPERKQQLPAEPVDLPDHELLQKAANSKYGDEFRALWAGDTTVTGGDHSRADFRLMKDLMYWTGGDETRSIALFDKSGLARRKKWDRTDYRQRTARKARMACTKFYRGTGDLEASKSTQLKATVQDLRRQHADYDWTRLVGTGERPNSMRGHTCRDVLKVLIDAIARHGKVVEGGVEVSLGRRKIALRAATSLRTVHKAIKHLEAEGWLVFKPPASEEKPGTYFMRATLHHILTTQGGGSGEENEAKKKHVSKGGGEDLRAPRLRWSAPGIKRLGKMRGAFLDALDSVGGTTTLQELARLLHKRPRDLRRRMLPMLEEAGILVVEGHEVHLVADWLERLEEARRLGGEVDWVEAGTGRLRKGAATLQAERYQRQSNAFRKRYKVKPDPHWTNNPEADGAVEHLRPADEPEPEKPKPYKEPPRPPEDDVAAQTRKVDQLVRHGMKRRYALEEVFGQVDLGARRGPPPEPEPPPGPDEECGWRKSRALDCECSDCLYPEPQYARPYRGVAV